MVDDNEVKVIIPDKRYRELLAIEAEEKGALLVKCDQDLLKQVDACLAVIKTVIKARESMVSQSISLINAELRSHDYRLLIINNGLMGGYDLDTIKLVKINNEQ